MLRSLVGSEMCIRDRYSLIVQQLTRFKLARPRRTVHQRQLGFLYRMLLSALFGTFLLSSVFRGRAFFLVRSALKVTFHLRHCKIDSLHYITLGYITLHYITLQALVWTNPNNASIHAVCLTMNSYCVHSYALHPPPPLSPQLSVLSNPKHGREGKERTTRH